MDNRQIYPRTTAPVTRPLPSRTKWTLFFGPEEASSLAVLEKDLQATADATKTLPLSRTSRHLGSILSRAVVFPQPASVLAIASTSHPLLGAPIALGFVANSIQVTCNCFIGVSRLVVAMDDCGDLRVPRSWIGKDVEGLAQVYWPYFVAAVPVILGYSLLPAWRNYTLGITVACSYVFMFSALSALVRRLRLDSEPFVRGRTAVGILSIAVISAGAMVLSYVATPQLGLRSAWSLMVIINCICGVGVNYRRFPDGTRTRPEKMCRPLPKPQS